MSSLTCPACGSALASPSFSQHAVRDDLTVVGWQCPHCGVCHHLAVDPSTCADATAVAALLADAQRQLEAQLPLCQHYAAAVPAPEAAPEESPAPEAAPEESPARKRSARRDVDTSRLADG